MTVRASIAESMSGSRGVNRRAEVDRLLELVGLGPELAQVFPGGLSGGQRQRVALARALGARPEVVIADEITSALDVSIQGTVLNTVRDLQRELNMSMLFISHNLAVVRYVATSIAVMYLGRIVEFGATEQVLTDPQHPYTRDLLAAVPESGQQLALPPAPAGATLAEPADPHHPPTGCRYHPRCPIGPMVHAEREICRTAEPSTDHRHQAACHFATEVEPASTREPIVRGPSDKGARHDPTPAHRRPDPHGRAGAAGVVAGRPFGGLRPALRGRRGRQAGDQPVAGADRRR